MEQSTLKNRTIFCRDNLDILQNINSHSIDLIYLDPPFNKKKVFTAPIGTSAEGASFKDVFREEDIKSEWLQTIKEDHEELYQFLQGVQNIGNRHNHYNFCYLAYMGIRLVECRRILKATGSIYLHCDQTMSHYLKLLLDSIFGEINFQNEIIWSYKSGGASEYHFARKHDTILVYVKDTQHKIFNPQHEKSYNRGYKAYKFQGVTEHKDTKCDLCTQDLPKNLGYHTMPYMRDVWDIDMVGRTSPERTGYPTQKPIALLERIIKASSHENAIVLDAFCGCATTCVASEKLNRQWIGIDTSHETYGLVEKRLAKEVAAPESTLQYENEVHYTTTPPKRTDRDDTELPKKYVCVISNPKYPNEYKVGIAKDWQARLNAYQTSDPDRNYKMEYKIHTPFFREIEQHIHETFENNHEAVKASLTNIIEEIKDYQVH